MYTTSSVETFPDAPFAYGHPPRPATDASTVLISFYMKKEEMLIKSFETLNYSAMLAIKSVDFLYWFIT